MKQRLFSLLLIIVSILTMVSCTTPAASYTVTFDADGGRVNGKTVYTTEYKKGEGMSDLPSATKAGYSFSGWYLDDELITSISPEQEGELTLKAKWTAFEYKTPITDSVTLTADYQNKDYYDDGIGVVTVLQYVDGDTTIVRTKNGHKVTIRYLGVDTPESTYTVEPWGFAAANHTKETLKNAKTIVLQTDNGKPGKDNADSTGKRYLAWVWADGKLINLELVELALANSRASDTTLADKFLEAVRPVSLAKVRVYGEKDPDYDYSTTYEQMSLKELHETYGTADAINKELDKGKKVKVSGTIVRKVGITSAYLQQYYIDEETGEERCYGIYLYGGFNENPRLGVGYSVIITGTIGYYLGSLQISDVSTSNVKVQSMNNRDEIRITEVEDLYNFTQDTSQIGNLIQITTPLTITTFYDTPDSNAFSLTASYQDKNGVTRTITIRIDQNITLRDPNGDRITTGEYFKGKTFDSLVTVVGYYDPSQNEVHDGSIQLMLVLMSDITLAQ